jgi:hypothetical protein
VFENTLAVDAFRKPCRIRRTQLLVRFLRIDFADEHIAPADFAAALRQGAKP